MSFVSSVYDTLMLPLALGAAPFFAFHPRGRERLPERYGDWRLSGGPYFWLHGASLGEVQGLIPIMRQIRERYPGIRILLTATSPTGLTAGAGWAHESRLLPFDSTPLLRRALDRVDISAFVFGETELWPALLGYLRGRAIKAFWVNARISPKTEGFYRRFKPIFSPLVEALSGILVGDEDSAERIISLGAQVNSVSICGNAKFDRKPIVDSNELVSEVRSIFFEGVGDVFTFASIHPEEAALFLPLLKEFAGTNLRFVVAPRHSERFHDFAVLLESLGINYSRRSSLKQDRRACPSQVLLLDTLGELESVYSFSSAAFLGGTIRDIGGHNPLEAAMYGVFLAAGESRWNIKQIAAELEGCGAMRKVVTENDLREILQELLRDPVVLKELGRRGRKVCERNRGATDRIIANLRYGGALPR